MERKDFLKKGLMGTEMFVADKALGNVIKNEVDELKELEPVGFNQLTDTASEIVPGTVLHKADSRGHANHGWLDSHHTFSFANYYNPERMHFGVLRVLNDDRVDPGMGFGTHPHDNMEIISIPLEGDLEHKDSMNNVATIQHGDIQVMSAGTGIFHSEYNKNKDQHVKFLQIWVFPKTKNVTPRYDQITLNVTDRHNKLQQILSPDKNDEGVWINQDAWFHIGRFDKDYTTTYTLKNPANGVYAFVIKGDFTIANTTLNERDGLGIWDTNKITLKANSCDAEVLLMEVPMVMM
jgi:redox-sensitive bicupin YhaK (pirin superfamily)